MKGIVLVVQLGFSFMAFLFLAAVNWYQGSELVSDQFDWNDTAKFTKLLNGIDTITSPKQITAGLFHILCETLSSHEYTDDLFVFICVIITCFADPRLPHGSTCPIETS
ncbi:DUF4306 domain-containing protein [Bacillus mojavensis]|nr:DUF4306 domain-containing protein [Bacillus mojavensis]MEC1682816.1 DUF4306 domain-containing protein [Bacillus mojavensis]MEC1707204.1 DUF4306 domain-containing protein [Bacillus mojavensis]